MSGPGPGSARPRVLLILTYYRPHVSGLTIYVERLARSLVDRGHDVTVLTSRYDRSLPSEEIVDGVRVVRVPVLARVSKGVVMPILPWLIREVRRHDVVSVHLPQLDGGLAALVARAWRRPTVLTYHCDLQLPAGVVNRVADAVVHVMNWVAATAAHRVVAYTQDYADHTSLLRRVRRKVRVVPPPVVMDEPDPVAVERFRQTHGVADGPVLGMAARLATEKGVEFLLEAARDLRRTHPGVRVLFAGPHEDVVGEQQYHDRLAPMWDELGDRWRFVGTLRPDEMPAFYGAIDVLVVASVNSTESFGLVQVEAMLCRTPVVATDLPGVRQPVTMTGMGRVVPVGDGPAIADAVRSIVDDPDSVIRPRAEIAGQFDIGATTDAYVRLFDEVGRS